MRPQGFIRAFLFIMKTNSKTLEKLKLVRVFLEKYDGKQFTYSDIEKYLVSNNLHGMNFYYFVYSGCVLKENGIYKLSKYFHNIRTIDVYMLGTEHLKQLRLKRVLKESKKEINKSIINYSITKIDFNSPSVIEAISLLKSLGCKILKPVNQFEEV